MSVVKSLINKVVITGGLLLAFSTSFAQFKYGVKGGINDVNLRIINTSDRVVVVNNNAWRPSFHLGFFANYTIGKRASLAGELLYSDKGFKVSSYNQHLAYLAVPLLFRYRVLKGFSMEAGPEFDILLSAHGKSSSSKLNNYDNYAPTDIGLSGGIHYDINSRISLGLRYAQGIANALNKKSTIILTDGNGTTQIFNLYDNGLKYKNQTLQLSIEYALHVKGSDVKK